MSQSVRVIDDIREWLTSRGSSSATMPRHRSVRGRVAQGRGGYMAIYARDKASASLGRKMGYGTDYAIKANDRRRPGRSK